MNELFKYNVEAFLSYSNTERFRDNWNTENDVEYITERSKLFLEAFNTLMNNIIGKEEVNLKFILRIITRKEIFEMYLKEGLVPTLKIIVKDLKLKNQNIQECKIPNFEITKNEYEYFFERAKEYYYDSASFHELRLSNGIESAHSGLDFYLGLRGEVFNTVLAQDYVKNKVLKESKENISKYFAMTKTGKKFLFLNKVNEIVIPTIVA